MVSSRSGVLNSTVISSPVCQRRWIATYSPGFSGRLGLAVDLDDHFWGDHTGMMEPHRKLGRLWAGETEPRRVFLGKPGLLNQLDARSSPRQFEAA